MTFANFSSLLISPAHAHQTETAADVGATFHFEPNDIPRAGQPNLAWFALTRRGGEPIALDACDCTLAVYDLSAQNPAEALATPPLEPVNAEGYQDIPGAEVNFPAIGAYELVIQGQPTQAGDFQPFEFRFEVTVAQGVAQGVANAEDDETAGNPVADAEESEIKAEAQTESQVGAIAPRESSDQASQGSSPSAGTLILGIGAIAILLGAWLWWRRRNTQQPQKPS
ncbi:MAG: hypothetical protein WBA57_14570 [Elainellaceae cyanobacterium]